MHSLFVGQEEERSGLRDKDVDSITLDFHLWIHNPPTPTYWWVWKANLYGPVPINFGYWLGLTYRKPWQQIRWREGGEARNSNTSCFHVFKCLASCTVGSAISVCTHVIASEISFLLKYLLFRMGSGVAFSRKFDSIGHSRYSSFVLLLYFLYVSRSLS